MKDYDFDKTLTPEELASETYLEWSNETLGRMTRYFAERSLEMDATGFEGIKQMGAMYVLVQTAMKTSAEEFKASLKSVTHKDKLTGDWEIIVRKTEKS